MPLSDLWADSDGHAARTDEDQALITSLKRSCRTAKARAASLLSRQKKKIERIVGPSIADTESDAKLVFQQNFLASKNTQWDPLEDSGHAGLIHTFDDVNGRRRAVFSYLKSFAGAVKRLFLSDPASSSQTPISHVISVNTNDDTNMKLGSGSRGSTEVRSVMNNIQEHIVVSKSSFSSDSEPVWFQLHQPIQALDRADTFGLYTTFMSWILFFCEYVGWRLQCWGVPSNLSQRVKQHTFVYMGDALRVNDAVFRHFVQTIHDQGSKTSTATCALQIHCSIHQLSLTRRYVALGFEGYFSQLVRLGHLFESHGFRSKFQVAMTKLIQQHFTYVRVTQLPPEATEYYAIKVQELRLHTDSYHMGLGGRRPGRCQGRTTASVRWKALQKLLVKDNGNPSDDLIVHFCTGQDCCPQGEEQALSTIVAGYLDLFSHMCVPLLYRWKHASSANCYVRDGCFLHRIVPRTLASMPSLKCFLAEFQPIFFTVRLQVMLHALRPVLSPKVSVSTLPHPQLYHTKPYGSGATNSFDMTQRIVRIVAVAAVLLATFGQHCTVVIHNRYSHSHSHES